LNTLFLTGMMGSGKSAIGRTLAAKLNWNYVDLDRAVEQDAGMTVLDIFEKEGESGFRKREREVSRSLDLHKCIVSTGGGFVIDAENRRWMRKTGFVVWLHVSPDVIFQRVRHRAHRPLLQGNMNVEFIAELFESRRNFYEDADISIDADIDDLEFKTELILEKVLNAHDPR